MWQQGMRAKWWPSSDNTPFGREEFDNLLGQYEGPGAAGIRATPKKHLIIFSYFINIIT
jgi:hypothetical protein